MIFSDLIILDPIYDPIYGYTPIGTGGAPPTPSWTSPYMGSYLRTKPGIWDKTPESPRSGQNRPPRSGQNWPFPGAQFGTKRGKKVPFNNSPIRDKIGHFLPKFWPFFAIFRPFFGKNCHFQAVFWPILGHFQAIFRPFFVKKIAKDKIAIFRPILQPILGRFQAVLWPFYGHFLAKDKIAKIQINVRTKSLFISGQNRCFIYHDIIDHEFIIDIVVAFAMHVST